MMRLLGGVLLAIGILVAGASGICSIGMFFGEEFGGDFWNMLPLVALFGGIPFAVGVGIAFLGQRMLRHARWEDEEPPAA